MIKKFIIGILIIFVIIFGFIFSKKFFKQNNQDYKLTFWSIQLKPIYEKQLNKIIADFEKENPPYKITWIDIPIQEAQKRTLASILSSTPPDLINLNPDFSVLLAQRNTLYFFSEDDTEQYNQNLVNKLKYNNKIYALPFYATSPVTIYNKKIYDKCTNENFITTYDDLFEISPKLKKCSNIAPFASSINENDTLAKILNKYDVYSFNNPQDKIITQEIFLNFNRMYKNNELPKDILASNHREIIEKYMSNQTLIIVAGSNFINMIKQNAPDIYQNSALSNQLTGSNNKYDVSLMNLIIPKKAKHKDMALKFALKLTNKKNQLELSKITNVLPANKYALDDEYFKNCPSDLYEQSRCISAKQLNNLVEFDFQDKNKKEINEAINKTLEEILLNKNTTNLYIENMVETLSNQVKNLQK